MSVLGSTSKQCPRSWTVFVRYTCIYRNFNRSFTYTPIRTPCEFSPTRKDWVETRITQSKKAPFQTVPTAFLTNKLLPAAPYIKTFPPQFGDKIDRKTCSAAAACSLASAAWRWCISWPKNNRTRDKDTKALTHEVPANCHLSNSFLI